MFCCVLCLSASVMIGARSTLPLTISDFSALSPFFFSFSVSSSSFPSSLCIFLSLCLDLRLDLLALDCLSSVEAGITVTPGVSDCFSSSSGLLDFKFSASCDEVDSCSDPLGLRSRVCPCACATGVGVYEFDLFAFLVPSSARGREQILAGLIPGGTMLGFKGLTFTHLPTCTFISSFLQRAVDTAMPLREKASKDVLKMTSLSLRQLSVGCGGGIVRGPSCPLVFLGDWLLLLLMLLLVLLDDDSKFVATSVQVRLSGDGGGEAPTSFA